MIGMFFLVMTTLSLMSLFPVIKKGEQLGTERSKAVQICNRLLEHVQMLGATDVTYNNLYALNLVDSSTNVQPYSFTHVPLDEASRYSPAQTLRDAEGELWHEELEDGSVLVKIRLRYKTDTGHTDEIETGTVIGGFR
jgi:hypothetical protein